MRELVGIANFMKLSMKNNTRAVETIKRFREKFVELDLDGYYSWKNCNESSPEPEVKKIEAFINKEIQKIEKETELRVAREIYTKLHYELCAISMFNQQDEGFMSCMFQILKWKNDRLGKLMRAQLPIKSPHTGTISPVKGE